MASQQKFFEFIKPGTNFDFVGRRKIWIILSLVAVLGSLAMLPINAFVLKDRGSMLNWGVDFRGGSEILVEFSRPVDAGQVREALNARNLHGAEVVRFGSADQGTQYLIRMGAVSVVSQEQIETAKTALAKVGDASLKNVEWSEGGDKLYLRFDKTLEPTAVAQALKNTGINTTQVQAFGRPDEHTFEATLIGLDNEVRQALDAKLGAGAVKNIPRVESVGAKAGKQLRDDGLRAMIGAILLIVIYVAFRFDFRYGPGTIVALFHDAILVIGAFAITYKEFSLTTLAALLTIIGFSMNDTIVVFDRIREDAAKYRDRSFDKVVNTAVNETLSRTILTSLTVFFVTLAMQFIGTGVIKDFAFAMNVGIVVGSYSSVFIAAPVLIWLNNRYSAKQKRQVATARADKGRSSRPAVRQDEEPETT
jgi:preprotein translocase subunit SecF